MSFITVRGSDFDWEGPGWTGLDMRGTTKDEPSGEREASLRRFGQSTEEGQRKTTEMVRGCSEGGHEDGWCNPRGGKGLWEIEADGGFRVN